MDKSLHPQRPETQRQGVSYTALLKIFDSALGWLVDFFRLTEEEQKDAGIYLDRPGDE